MIVKACKYQVMFGFLSKVTRTGTVGFDLWWAVLLLRTLLKVMKSSSSMPPVGKKHLIFLLKVQRKTLETCETTFA